jgi:hypothetical protein
MVWILRITSARSGRRRRFPDRSSIIPLVGALPAEQHDEKAIARRYMSAKPIGKGTHPPSTESEELIAIEAARQARMERSTSHAI